MKNADNILRVGGVGTGRIFQHAHLRVYPPFLGKAWLTGFYDLNPRRAQEAKEKYAAMLDEWATNHPAQAEAARANSAELRAYDSLDALLDKVDVIDVATHARGKMPATLAAIEKGVHVMVEKPMARTWTEADRAARALARRPGVFFQLNDDNVFDPKYRTVRDAIARGDIGNVQQITLIRGSGLLATSVLKAQANALENGGGCLMDYGSHGLAGAWSLLGLDYRPIKVEAVDIAVRYRHRVLEGDPFIMEVDDNAQIKVLFEEPQSGAWATVFMEASWCGGHIGLTKEKAGGQSGGHLRVWGDRGVIESDSSTLTTVRHWDGGETAIPHREYPGESVSFTDEIGSFLDGLRAGKPSAIDLNFGADVTAICGAAYLSALRRRPVTLDEFKAYSREFIQRHGDGEQADDAIVLDLLEPYRAKESMA